MTVTDMKILVIFSSNLPMLVLIFLKLFVSETEGVCEFE